LSIFTQTNKKKAPLEIKRKKSSCSDATTPPKKKPCLVKNKAKQLLGLFLFY
jgi:hypothetical protein